MNEDMKKILPVLLTVVVLLAILGVFNLFSGQRGGGSGGDQNNRLVYLYYYNETKDRELSGGNNVLCSREAVLPVERLVPASDSIIEQTVELLLKGEIRPEEAALGFTTEFPGDNFSLQSVSLENGILTLAFSDPANFSTGGSCRVGLLWAQIEKTAKQFPGVLEVRFTPEELFQP